MKMRRVIIISALALTVAFASAFVWYVLQPRWQTVSVSNNPTMTFQVPVAWNVTVQSTDWEEHRVDRQILLVTGGKQGDPDALVQLSAEKGIGMGAGFSGQQPLDMISRSAQQQFSTIYAGYALRSVDDETIDGYKAKRIDFTYSGTDGKTIRDQVHLILHDSDLAIYLETASKADLFDVTNASAFTHLLSSINIE